MRIAYLILAHNAPNHLTRLVRALDSPDASFVIHIDRKSDISLFRESLFRRNVTFLEDRVAVYWGEFSTVQATIELLKTALNRSPCPDYVCLLSGSDYPLRSPQYIEEFLLRNRGWEFMNLVPMPCAAVGKELNRLQEYRLQTFQDSSFVRRAVARLNRMINDEMAFRRDYSKVLRGMKPYAGSQWWALTQNAARHVLAFVAARPDVVKFFRNSRLPDESFFHTIIGNSEFAPRVVRNLTFADWSRPGGGPAIIDRNHLKAFIRTERVVGDDFYGRGELLFARKFPDDSAELTDFIDRHLIKRNPPRSAMGNYSGSVSA
jgi:hypothetical protein